jgi:hypothetical protein
MKWKLQMGLALVGMSSLVFAGIDKIDNSVTFGIVSPRSLLILLLQLSWLSSNFQIKISIVNRISILLLNCNLSISRVQANDQFSLLAKKSYEPNVLCTYLLICPISYLDLCSRFKYDLHATIWPDPYSNSHTFILTYLLHSIIT